MYINEKIKGLFVVMDFNPGWSARRYSQAITEIRENAPDPGTMRFELQRLRRAALRNDSADAVRARWLQDDAGIPTPPGFTDAPRPARGGIYERLMAELPAALGEGGVSERREAAQLAEQRDRFDREEAAMARQREREQLERNMLDGEPAQQRGVVRDLIQKAPAVSAKYKICDVQMDIGIGGSLDLPVFGFMQSITVGSLGNQRTGRTIRIRAIEYRLRASNITYRRQETNAGFTWAGTPGIAGSTRTVPAIIVPVSSWQTFFYDATGALPAVQLQNNGAIPPIINVAPVAVPLATTELASATGPAAAITLKAAEVNIVDQQGFPALPAIVLPPSYFMKGYLGGEMPTVRVGMFVDHSPQSAVVFPAIGMSCGDVFETEGVYNDYPGVCGVYNQKTLDRFTHIFDTTWEPRACANEVIMVRPAKEVCINVSYPASAVGVQTQPMINQIYLYATCSEPSDIIPGSETPYLLEGWVRFFYEDD